MVDLRQNTPVPGGLQGNKSGDSRNGGRDAPAMAEDFARNEEQVP
jgi:hypothetical protein